MNPVRSAAQAATALDAAPDDVGASGTETAPEGVGDVRARAGDPASGTDTSPDGVASDTSSAPPEPGPAFAMLGDLGAAACEGDTCALP